MWPFNRKKRPVLVAMTGPTTENLRLQKQLGFPVGDDDACWEHQFRMFMDREQRIKALEADYLRLAENLRTAHEMAEMYRQQLDATVLAKGVKAND